MLIKRIILGVIFFSLYGWVFWHLVYGTHTIQTTVASISLSILSILLRSLFCLRLPKIYSHGMLIAAVILSCLWYSIGTESSGRILGAILTIHSVYIVVAYSLAGYVRNQVSLNTRWLSVAIRSWLSVLMSFGYSMLILGYNQTLSLDCALLRQESMRIIDDLSRPLELGSEQLFLLKDLTTSWFISTPDNTQETSFWLLSGESLSDVMLSSDSLSWLSLSGSLTGELTLGSIITISGSPSISIAGIEIFAPGSVVSNFLNDKKNLDLGTCDYTLSKIKTLYAQSNTQITVLVFLTILLSLFMSIIVWVGVVLTWAILAIAFYFGLYGKTSETATKETIK